MRATSSLVICLILNLSLIKTKAQEYTLHTPNKNLTVEDGLCSNFVYGAVQDDEGFIWFYTDKGLSKFDGFSMKNFSSAEGISRPNVWMLYKDTNNRLWLGTHDNVLSYVQGDSVHTVGSFENSGAIYRILRINTDTLLIMKSTYSSGLYLIGQDSFSNISYDDLSYKQKLIFEQRLNCLNQINWDSFGHKLKDHELDINGYSNGFAFCSNNNLYALSALNNKFFTFSMNSGLGSLYILPENNRFYTPVLLNDKLFLSGTQGLMIFKDNMLKTNYIIKSSNNLLRSNTDNCGNVWSGSQTKGVLYYNKNYFEKIKVIYSNTGDFINVTNVANKTIIELESKDILIFDNKTKQIKKHKNMSGNRESGEWFDNYVWIRGNYKYKLFDKNNFVFDFFQKNKELSKLKTNKWIPYNTHKLNEDSIISITSNLASLIVKKDNLYSFKEFYHDKYRIFFSYITSDRNLLLASLKKIYVIDKNLILKDSIELSNNKSTLNISCLTEVANSKTLIAGTNGNGAYFFNKNQGWILLPKSENLECKSIFNIGKYLLIHSNKGIFSYKFNENKFEFFTLYAYSYGLNPDNILLCYPHNDSIYVVSKTNIIAFSPNLIDATNNTIRIYECLVNLTKLDISKKIVIPSNFKNISFRFSTFDYTRMDDTKFRYRFKNSDPWNELKSNYIEITQLSFGEHTLFIEAFNKYSNQILATKILPFEILTPWYRTWWFLSSFNILLLGTIVFFFRRQTLKNKVFEHYMMTSQYNLRETKIKLLENQMNPHFLFNSLTAIKSFLLLRDSDNAKFYLNSFSKLMRRFLDSSRSSLINIENEIDMIRQYLILEKMRFDNRFDFEIIVDKEIDSSTLKIPTMLIQPIVENSVRHGLFHRPDSGMITVSIKKIGTDLHLIVADNGIGIKASQAMKQSTTTNHESHASDILNEKIELLNSFSQYNITLFTGELNPEDPKYKGTLTKIVIKGIFYEF